MQQEILLIASDEGEISSFTNMLLGQGHQVKAIVSAGMIAELDPGYSPAVVILTGRGESINDDLQQCMVRWDIEDVPVLIVCDAKDDLAPAYGPNAVIDHIRRPCNREDFIARVRVLLKIARLAREMADLREQLRSVQKMECVGALAAGVVHEFNNLMFSVMGFADLARLDGGGDIAALKESAEISFQVAKRATATAASLLAFSRQARTPKTKGDVNEVVTSAVRLLIKDMEKNGIKVELQLGELPQTMMAVGPMQQVLVNLFINAWHAMSVKQGDRKLTVSTKCDERNHIVISVSDTGIGIPADKLDKIFEPFFTTKNGANSNGVQGTGLGLAIVKEVLKEHGGVVRVESEEGKGATFLITLPIELSDSEYHETEYTSSTQAASLSDRKMSVLLIDDEADNLKAMSRMLLKHGHSVYATTNLAEAVTVHWTRSFDIIVLDLLMPGVSGAEGINRLRDSGITTPIMVCTGCAETAVVEKALAAGVQGIVMKPFTASEFIARMHACLEPVKQ